MTRVTWILGGLLLAFGVRSAAAVSVRDGADLSVTETAEPPAGISIQGMITYHISVVNNGPADATGVMLTDTLPAGINYKYVTITTSQGACAQATVTVSCALGSLAAHATAAVNVAVHPLTTENRTNVVSVAGNEADADPSNNSASISTANFEVALSDLTVSVTDAPDPLLAGNTVNYHITVTDLQDDCASDVVVTDSLPSRAALVSMTPSQGTCTHTSCNVGTLCPGQSASIDVVAALTTPGTATNTVTVPDRPSDPDGNNTASTTTTVVANLVAVAATDPDAAELGQDPGTFTITRQGGAAADLIVHFAIGGTAASGNDYKALIAADSATIRAGEASVSITIAPQDDNAIEGPETVVLTLAPGTGYGLGSPTSATVTIADHGLLPVVSIEATDPDAAELGADPGTFVITRAGDLAPLLTIPVAVSGTAASDDYAFLPSLSPTVTLAPGQATATITVRPVDDGRTEGPETVTLTLGSASRYELSAQAAATVTIGDHSRLPVLSISATDPDAAELGGDPGVLTISRAGDLSNDLFIPITVGGTAILSQDYSFASPLPGDQVRLLAGHASTSFVVLPVDDSAIEGPETVSLALGASPLHYVLGAQNTATITIADHPLPPKQATVSVAATASVAYEGGRDPATFTISRAGDTSRDLRVDILLRGTASFSDFSLSPGSVSSVTIPRGQFSTNVNVIPFNDEDVEGPETVVMTLLDGPEYEVGASAAATVTILDRDSPPLVVVTATTPNAAELGNVRGKLTISRTGRLDPIDVQIAWAGTARRNDDYNVSASAKSTATTVALRSGVKSVDVDVAPIDDDKVEGPETAVLELRPGTGYVIGADATATVTIADHPLVPTITVSALSTTLIEGSGDRAVLRISRAGDLAGSLPVQVIVSGTADPGTDYTVWLPSKLQFARNQAATVTILSGRRYIDVELVSGQDRVREGTETLTLSLLDGAGYDIGPESSATVSIADDDVPPTVTVTAEPIQIDEPERTRSTGRFRISRLGSMSRDLPISVLVLGTATRDVDYTLGLPPRGLVIPQGKASIVIDIQPLTDTNIEGPETVILMVLSTDGYEAGAPASAMVTIVDVAPRRHH